MAGYRQPGFDPNHWQPVGAPLKPYNWVQWCGVGGFLVGVAIFVTYFAGRFGWIHPVLKDSMTGTSFMLIGVVLINSRRQEIPEAERDQYREKQRRRTYLALAVALAAAAIGFAIAIYTNSHGA